MDYLNNIIKKILIFNSSDTFPVAPLTYNPYPGIAAYTILILENCRFRNVNGVMPTNPLHFLLHGTKLNLASSFEIRNILKPTEFLAGGEYLVVLTKLKKNIKEV